MKKIFIGIDFSKEKFEDHGVGSTDHFLKFLYYTLFLTPHDPFPISLVPSE